MASCTHWVKEVQFDRLGFFRCIRGEQSADDLTHDNAFFFTAVLLDLVERISIASAWVLTKNNLNVSCVGVSVVFKHNPNRNGLANRCLGHGSLYFGDVQVWSSQSEGDDELVCIKGFAIPCRGVIMIAAIQHVAHLGDNLEAEASCVEFSGWCNGHNRHHLVGGVSRHFWHVVAVR